MIVEIPQSTIANQQPSISNVMAEKVLMLALSPTMETGTIAKWSVQEGDSVESGDTLCEVETDKAVMDYETMQEGVVLKIVLPEGGEAKVGDTIAIIGEEGEDISDLLAEAQDVPKSASRPAEPAAFAESVSIPEQGQLLSDSGRTGDRLRSSPLARTLAKEAGLDLTTVQGSGPGGRIVKRDIEQALQTRTIGTAAVPTAAATSVHSLADATIPVSQKRKIIAQRLAESKYSAPHYYLKVAVNMGEILEARKALNAKRLEKVSLNAFLIKFAAEALAKHPVVNSSWNDDTIIQHGSVDIGLAVAQPDGLITPVVRNCANKGILEIDRVLADLIQKARENRLQPDEYTGATFTISSLGSFGIQEFTAIINPPGSAILAVGAIRKEPVVGDDDQISIQSNMVMTLSCDHRVIDGAVGAAFLKNLQDMLEHPIQAFY